MKTLDLTPEQEQAVWNALGDLDLTSEQEQAIWNALPTLDLTEKQEEAVWNALEDSVDEIKKELYECRGRASIFPEAAREELKAAREVLEIFEAR